MRPSSLLGLWHQLGVSGPLDVCFFLKKAVWVNVQKCFLILTFMSIPVWFPRDLSASIAHLFTFLNSFTLLLNLSCLRTGCHHRLNHSWCLSSQHRGFCLGTHVAMEDQFEIRPSVGNKDSSFPNRNAVEVECEIYEPQVPAPPAVMHPVHLLTSRLWRL